MRAVNQYAASLGEARHIDGYRAAKDIGADEEMYQKSLRMWDRAEECRREFSLALTAYTRAVAAAAREQHAEFW